MRLKKSYTSREVAALTGLTARQLQGWDAGRLVQPSIAPMRTAAGGFTERRYSPIELFELLVLADLRRRGFSVARLRRLVRNLRARFGVRLFDAIEGGPLKLYTDGSDVYARTGTGQLYSLVRTPEQPLLTLGHDERLKELGARIRSRRRHPTPASRRRRETGPVVVPGGRAGPPTAGRRPGGGGKAGPVDPLADEPSEGLLPADADAEPDPSGAAG